jgi:uncharacterized membrane protein
MGTEFQDDDRARDDRERYLRKMSDRLHDRFLEKPAFLDLEFIRSEIKKLDSQIDTFLVNGLSWERVRGRLGDPAEYADAVFASRLLSPEVNTQGSRPGVLATVLKILFVVAPVNFLVAVGPLLLGLIVLVLGWLASALVIVVPSLLLARFAFDSAPSSGIGLAEVFLLIGAFAFGWLLALFMMIVSRLLFWAVWTWLGWNIAFLRAEPRK